MFEPSFETLRKATEATIQIQQDAFRKWVSLWPGMPPVQPALGEQVQKAERQWTEFGNELVKQQREVLEAQYQAGLKAIEEAYKLAQVKSPEELRSVAIELWKKSFDSLRQVFEAQTKALQVAWAKWAELVTPGAG
jgi:hypothetical protein